MDSEPVTDARDHARVSPAPEAGVAHRDRAATAAAGKHKGPVAGRALAAAVPDDPADVGVETGHDHSGSHDQQVKDQHVEDATS